MPRDELYKHYLEYCKARRMKPMTNNELGQFFRSSLVGAKNGGRPSVGGDRKRMYKIPSVAECRQRYEEHIGHAMEWGDACEDTPAMMEEDVSD